MQFTGAKIKVCVWIFSLIQLGAGAAQAKEWDVGVEVKGFTSTEGPDITQSHIYANAGSVLQNVYDGLDIPPNAKKSFVVSGTVHFSFVPTLMAGRAKEGVLNKTDIAINAKIPGVRNQVLEVLRATSPGFRNLPPEVQNDAANNIALNRMAPIRAAKAQMIGERVEDLRFENSLQMAVIEIRHENLPGGRSLIYVQIGKANVNPGMPGERSIEANRPIYSDVIRESGTSGTGLIRGGYMTKLGDDADASTLTLEVYAFHDRPAFVSGMNELGLILSQTDAEHARHVEWYKTNSALFKAMLATRTTDIYFTIASFDGKAAVAGGAIFRLTPDNQLEIHGYYGNRPTLKDGVAVYARHLFTNNVAVYVGAEFLKERLSPIRNADKTFDEDTLLVGLAVQLKRLWGINVVVEGYRSKAKGVDRNADVRGFRAGLSKKY
jgi:hypothetical protein